MTKALIKSSIGAVTIMAMLLSAPIWADDQLEDFERARQLISEGKIVPLDTILNRAEIKPGWRLLEVEFERDNSQWVYELEVLKADGEVIELQYDAETGAYLGIED